MTSERLESRISNERHRKDILSRQLQDLLEKQRLYNRAIEKFKKECTKNHLLQEKINLSNKNDAKWWWEISSDLTTCCRGDTTISYMSPWQTDSSFYPQPNLTKDYFTHKRFVIWDGHFYFREKEKKQRRLIVIINRQYTLLIVWSRRQSVMNARLPDTISASILLHFTCQGLFQFLLAFFSPFHLRPTFLLIWRQTVFAAW